MGQESITNGVSYAYTEISYYCPLKHFHGAYHPKLQALLPSEDHRSRI